MFDVGVGDVDYTLYVLCMLDGEKTIEIRVLVHKTWCNIVLVLFGMLVILVVYKLLQLYLKLKCSAPGRTVLHLTSLVVSF